MVPLMSGGRATDFVMLQARAASRARLGYLASDMRWNVQATDISRHVLYFDLSLIATPEKVRHPLATRSASYLVPERDMTWSR